MEAVRWPYGILVSLSIHAFAKFQLNHAMDSEYPKLIGSAGTQQIREPVLGFKTA